MRLIAVVISCLLTSGCATASKVTYRVISEPQKAPVEVNGINISETPTEVSLECTKKWVGVLNSPNGWAPSSGYYEVKVSPPKGFIGQSQIKQIDPCQWKGEGNPELKFNLRLESEVGRILSNDIIEVLVEGIDDGFKSNKQQDREEAILNAKLQAVERAGVNISSITTVENFALKKDWIEEKAEAILMPGFQVIDKGYQADGTYLVILSGKIKSINTTGN